MRGECKYTHEGIRYKCVCGEWEKVKVIECWGEKEPSICDARRKECSILKEDDFYERVKSYRLSYCK